MPFHELLVGSFNKNKHSQVAAIQVHQSMARAWTGDAEVVEEFAGEGFAEVARILGRVVQMNFRQPMKPLPGGELVEVKGERRLGINRLKRIGTLQVNGDVCVD